MNIKTKDEIVQRVIKHLDDRSQKGFKTYGVSLKNDNTRDTVGWLTMLQEELLDAANYIEKLKEILK